jgi:type II secretory pathway pseudopilin PulG
MITRLRSDERGMTLIISMMIVFIVMILATVVVDQAIHNSTQSGFDRQRLQSVDAAEAGLDYVYNQLEHTPAQSLSTADITGSVAVSPGTSSFTVHPTFYSDTAGTQLFTGTPSDTNYPSSVKLVSTGITNGKITRKMETFMVIHPTSGGFQGAVLSGASTTLVNSFTISGNNGNDGDITVNCDTTCSLTSSSGNQTIKGNLYVPKGNLVISTAVHVYGDVWANGSVTVNHPQAQIDGNIISSTSSVDVTSGHVNGTGYYCTTVSGTANIGSGTVKLCQGAPPAQTFPHVTFDDTAAPNADPKWTTGCSATPVTNCYQLVQFSGATACTLARNYIEGSGAGTFNGGAGVPDPYTGVVVRILNTCTYNPSNNAKITVGKDLALVSNGSISLSQQTTWTGANGSRKLHFIIPWPQTCDASGNPGIAVGNNTNFDATISVGIYTPCTATMSNQNAFYGQVVGGTVSIGNNWSMNYRPIVIPGAHVTGFTEDIAYIREIAS